MFTDPKWFPLSSSLSSSLRGDGFSGGAGFSGARSSQQCTIADRRRLHHLLSRSIASRALPSLQYFSKVLLSINDFLKILLTRAKYLQLTVILWNIRENSVKSPDFATSRKHTDLLKTKKEVKLKPYWLKRGGRARRWVPRTPAGCP